MAQTEFVGSPDSKLSLYYTKDDSIEKLHTGLTDSNSVPQFTDKELLKNGSDTFAVPNF